MGSPRLRHTIKGLMVVVAIVAFGLTWFVWMARARPFPVSGTISYNGQPLASGKIVFVPANPAGQNGASPITSGKYSLTTFSRNDGAIPGTYTIVIVSPGLPARYQSQATTGLSAQVQKSTNVIDLDLR